MANDFKFVKWTRDYSSKIVRMAGRCTSNWQMTSMYNCREKSNSSFLSFLPTRYMPLGSCHGAWLQHDPSSIRTVGQLVLAVEGQKHLETGGRSTQSSHRLYLIV